MFLAKTKVLTTGHKKNISKKNPTIKSLHFPQKNLIQLLWSINHFWLVVLMVGFKADVQATDS